MAKETGAYSARREFVFYAETKNTYRFEEVIQPGKAPVVGALYIRKTEFPGGRPPARIAVVISADLPRPSSSQS